ncbi:7617_t:CDS:1 [Ambispora leptoticha]|uniref:7617_t:CDS:1 n=1 Tax=Ambispora leptoticha TaxID=144679 RepID=A0A9N8W2V0_9GLOM|nr:7617_t:CDS:1 [Ambispora leptoticha]
MAVLKSIDLPAIDKKQNLEIDTTGRHSIFQIRGAFYPPRRRKRKSQNSNPKIVKGKMLNCKEVLADEDIQLLETYLERIDQKLAKLTTIVEKEQNKELQPLNVKNLKFSFLNIDVLLELSKNLGNGAALSEKAICEQQEQVFSEQRLTNSYRQ